MCPGTATHDGVVGVWYGKGPGVDRATDALRHANMYGANPRGGMLLLVGDDPASKSSTVPAVSERSLAALGMPVLFPRNAGEIVTMAMHGVALSRASGCVVALKIVADVADGAWSVDGSDVDVDIVVPAGRVGGPAVRLPAAADGRARRQPRRRGRPVRPRAGRSSTPSAPPTASTSSSSTRPTRPRHRRHRHHVRPVRQALRDLGVDDAALHHAGIRLLRIGMPTRSGPDAVREFADGLEEILVVEEKTAFVETQVRDILYGTTERPADPRQEGRHGRLLVPAGRRADRRTAAGAAAPRARATGLELKRRRHRRCRWTCFPPSAPPYFCSGCPHNRSTAVPEGSLAGGGIGCHTMVTMSGRTDSAVTGLTQMGGEGAQWIGQAPFTDVAHMFQNIGDGTFFHSGQLAVQACVAAGVNITYKLLYNEVVAMTGAQDAEGALTVPELTHKLTAEGVKQIIVCADEPDAAPTARDLAKGTLLWHRDRLDEAQRALREVTGRHRADLRPAVRRRGAPAAQARQAADPHHPRRHQRGGVRGLRRLRRQDQLPVGAAGRHRVRPQDADRPDLLQHRLHLPRRRLPVVRHRRGAEPSRKKRRWRRKAARRRRPTSARPVVVEPTHVADAHERLPRRHRRHRHRHGEPGARHRGAARRATRSRASTRSG